jgi:hypothetical protein
MGVAFKMIPDFMIQVLIPDYLARLPWGNDLTSLLQTLNVPNLRSYYFSRIPQGRCWKTNQDAYIDRWQILDKIDDWYGTYKMIVVYNYKIVF